MLLTAFPPRATDADYRDAGVQMSLSLGSERVTLII